MNKPLTKPELLAPAGTLDILKIAFLYGADAVYCGTPKFAMRSRVEFSEKDLQEGIKYSHSISKKIYITLNAFPHPEEIKDAQKYALALAKLKPDAFIIADPGMVKFVLDNTDIPVHLSTQANTTNQLSAKFWQELGAERIVLARELSLSEIKVIHNSLNNCTLEAFVHGAMCMAYSGRCQISNYMTGRDPNRGECIQACRFKYKMHGLEEQFRPGEIFPTFEDEEGTHILNSKDLCMIEYLPDLIEAGISGFKIEGRLKSEYYVASVVRAYRQAIDAYFENKEEYGKRKIEFKEELLKTANRGFTTGFYFGKPDSKTNNYPSSRAMSSWGYIGRVKKYSAKEKMLEFEIKNHLLLNSDIEIITPSQTFSSKLNQMLLEGKPIEVAHAGMIVQIPFPNQIPKDSLIRIQLS